MANIELAQTIVKLANIGEAMRLAKAFYEICKESEPDGPTVAVAISGFMDRLWKERAGSVLEGIVALAESYEELGYLVEEE